jgi:hypothetical protein
VVGDPGMDNWVVAEPGADWKDGRKISVSEKSSGNVAVFGAGPKAFGECIMWGRSNVVNFGEHNAQPVNMNIYVSGDETLTFIGSRTTCNNAAQFNQGVRRDLS